MRKDELDELVGDVMPAGELMRRRAVEDLRKAIRELKRTLTEEEIPTIFRELLVEDVLEG